MAAVKLKTTYRGLSAALLALMVLLPGSAERLVSAAPERPERVRQARYTLARAVEEYKAGKPDRAFFHWRVARDLAPLWSGRRADFHKLHGLLLMGEGREAEAMQAFTQSLRIAPDPFLHYIQGDYFLEFRNLREARTAYTGALAAFFGEGKGKGTPLPSPEYTLPARLPLICPGENAEKHDPWLARGLKNRFTATEWAGVNWGRTLSREELVLSILQAMLLARYFEGPDGKSVEQYRRWLNGLQIAEDEVTFAATLSLVRNPLSDANHMRCLHGLEAMKRRQEKIIAAGSSEPAARHLKTVQEYLRRAHWNRIAVRGDVSAYYSYGSYLMREGKAIEALHNFRRALRLTKYSLDPDLDGRSLNEAAQTYRQLQFAYERLGKGKDAGTVADFATLLEDLAHRIKSREPGAADRVAGVRAALIERARENLYNREGLLFLIRYAGEVKGETPASLRTRLAERDRRADEEELLSAFGYLYE